MTDSESDAGSADFSSEPSLPQKPSEIVLFEGDLRLDELELKHEFIEMRVGTGHSIPKHSDSHVEATVMDERGNRFTVPLVNIPYSLFNKMVQRIGPLPYIHLKLTVEE